MRFGDEAVEAWQSGRTGEHSGRPVYAGGPSLARTDHKTRATETSPAKGASDDSTFPVARTAEAGEDSYPLDNSVAAMGVLGVLFW